MQTCVVVLASYTNYLQNITRIEQRGFDIGKVRVKHPPILHHQNEKIRRIYQIYRIMDSKTPMAPIISADCPSASL